LPDEITLTLPSDEAFHPVAHLVLGGLAARLDLTIEHLQDLELAVDTLLGRAGASDVTLLVRVLDGELRTLVGPFASIREELDHGRSGEALDLRRILATVCDGVGILDRDGGQWVELTKRVEQADGSGA
jgi:hypothetical protein